MYTRIFHETVMGRFGIAEENQAIVAVYLPWPVDDEIIVQDIGTETPLLEEAFRQLHEYLAGKRREFTLPLDAQGTEFRRRVWRELRNIPYGETVSYQTVAERIGNPKAARAVGAANGRNPIPIFIPCHRVIGASGNLVGFGGGLELKEKLLNLEKTKCGG